MATATAAGAPVGGGGWTRAMFWAAVLLAQAAMLACAWACVAIFQVNHLFAGESRAGNRC